MSPYAYAYRTCKHPCAYACAYAYACVVRVNQAYTFSKTIIFVFQIQGYESNHTHKTEIILAKTNLDEIPLARQRFH